MASKVKITDKDKGFKKLMASLGDMGSITVGVQGEKAEERHITSPDMTVGQIAAIHELGLGGVPKRSWLLSWMDENEKRMTKETASALKLVLAGALTRNKAMAGLGYAWTEAIREVVSSGRITPPLPAPRPDGTSAPLYDTHMLHNAITYKVWLPQAKSIRNRAQREAVRRGGK